MMESSGPASRRRWLGWMSAASLSSGVLAAAPAAAGADAPGTRIYNILDFGAKGDGNTLATQAVQAAIDACNKDHGGTVLVPAGVFVIGTVEMKSHVTLHIAAEGKLLGSADGKQYHAADAIPLRGDSTLGDGNVGLILRLTPRTSPSKGRGPSTDRARSFAVPAAVFRPSNANGAAAFERSPPSIVISRLAAPSTCRKTAAGVRTRAASACPAHWSRQSWRVSRRMLQFQPKAAGASSLGSSASWMFSLR
jgi:hypothetical protein